MRQGHHTQWVVLRTIVGLTLMMLVLGGCAQQQTASPPPPSAPVSAAPPPSPQSLSRGKATHQAVLDAQSAYWRAHGQGLNEATPAAKKPSVKKSEGHSST